MAQRDITQALPAELLARIFSFLDERHDVAASRLVCRTFHKLASPYLIATIVFALRADTLRHMRDVVHHEYFSKQITHLVYDASRYSEHVATDWHAYVSRCKDSPRYTRDEAWGCRRRDEDTLLDSLAVMSTSAALHDPRRDNEEDYWDSAFEMGCQHTFPDYFARQRFQRDLEARGLPVQLLTSVFHRCPKLRNVLFTDFRALARRSESYDDCCNRLFGLTLPPDLLGQHTSGSLLQAMLAIFQAVDAAKGSKIDSFDMPPHCFSSLAPILDNSLAGHHMPGMIQISEFDYRTEFSIASLGSLQSIGLSYEGFPWPLGDSSLLAPDLLICRLLQPAAECLLRLCLADFSTLKAPLETENGKTFLLMRFPRLGALDLRHLLMPDAPALQDFLRFHASTLREVRLVGCVSSDSDDEQAELAEMAGECMRLNGVEIVTLEDLIGGDAATQPTLKRIEERERIWLNGRRNLIQRSILLADSHRLLEDAARDISFRIR